jgi:hypothetical protein
VQVKRKSHVIRSVSPVSPRSISTVHRASLEDHSARATRRLKRTWRSMPYARAVSCT